MNAEEVIATERAKRENIHATLPPEIPAVGAPDEEFVKTMAEIERGKQVSQVTPPPSVPAKVEDKLIILGYKYSGSCPTCHNDVKTLELDADGKHFAVAYCLFCQNQIQSKEVPSLKSPKMIIEKGDEIRKINGGMIIIKDKKKGGRPKSEKASLE